MQINVYEHLRGNCTLPNKHVHTAYLIPSHWLCSEERTGQLNRKPFLVILWLVLRHSEQNSSCICCWERKGEKASEEMLRLSCIHQLKVPLLLTYTFVPRVK